MTMTSRGAPRQVLFDLDELKGARAALDIAEKDRALHKEAKAMRGKLERAENLRLRREREVYSKAFKKTAKEGEHLYQSEIDDRLEKMKPWEHDTKYKEQVAARVRAPHKPFEPEDDDVIEINDLHEQFEEMDKKAEKEEQMSKALKRSMQMAEMTGELEEGMRSLMQGGGM